MRFAAQPSPVLATIDAGAAQLRASGAAVVVGVGGGSVLDSAKAIAALAANEGTWEDYQLARRTLAHPALPVVAVPTTAGTGSEAGAVAVIGNPALGIIKSVTHPSMLPRLVILDPDLTASMPPRLTALVGLDAFIHALESYVSLKASPLTEGASLDALALLAPNLPRAVRDGQDMDARGNVLLGSYRAGQALNAGIGAAHILAQPISAVLGIGHPNALSTVLPHTVAYNAEYAAEKYARVRAILDPAAPADTPLAAIIAGFLHDLGLDQRLRDYGATAADIPRILDAVVRSTGHIWTNPRPVTLDGLEAILAGGPVAARKGTHPMSRTLRVVTTSLATLEDTAPPFNLRPPEPEENLRRGLALLDAAGRQGADLACLPEGFLAAGLPGARLRAVAEPIPGPAFDAVAACARQYHMNVVAGFYAEIAGRLHNLAAVIDRTGALVGTYSKNHPTEGEIAGGVTPGDAAPVFATDVGRLGVGICFDVNWPGFWADLAAQGADLVCWISAYEGGFPLQAYAWLHRYPIVTSVWPYHARVIDKTGRVLATTSRWGRIAVCDLDLDKRLFHTDGQADRILPIQARYGAQVRVETFTEEHLFTLETLDPALTPDAVIAEFGLVEYDDYVARCTRAQAAARPQPAPAGAPG